ncbi:MAG: nucleotidyltransferase family protein, partial [Oscillospiraceae bacterium]|nr:nucleotidyltransferase family protein [Candidatus Equicaccousia limihippi]
MNIHDDIYILIKQSLFGGCEDRLGDIHITHDLLSELIDQSIFGLPAHILGDLKMDADIRDEWEQLIFADLQHYYRLMTVQQETIKLLDENGIKAVVLKGCSASMNYPHPQNRVMGDIDLLINKDFLEEAKRILLNNGFVLVKSPIDRHFCFDKNEIRLELHYRFSEYMESDQADFLDNRLQESIDNATVQNYVRYSWYSFDTVDKGLVLLQHIRQHLLIGIGLKPIIDWMMFVNAEMTDELWETFAPFAQRCGNKNLAIIVTRMCEMYLGLPGKRKWCFAVDDKLCGDLLEYIEKNGAYGRKKEYYSNATTSALRKLRKKPFRTL